MDRRSRCREVAAAARRERRWVQIAERYLGGYHDGAWSVDADRFGRLADFALSNGDLMPAIRSDLALAGSRPRWTSEYTFTESRCRGPSRTPVPESDARSSLAVLAEDPRQWPCAAIEDIIGILAEAPETAADARLSELRSSRTVSLPAMGLSDSSNPSRDYSFEDYSRRL
jgi:hypothetical protein